MFYIWLLIALWVGVMVGVIVTALLYMARGNTENSYDGTMLVENKDAGGIVYTLEIDGDLEKLQDKKEIRLRVTPWSSEVRD